MTSRHLPPPRCATTGYHAQLVPGAPQDLGPCINIEERCPDCGKVVIVTSVRKDLLTDQELRKLRDS